MKRRTGIVLGSACVLVAAALSSCGGSSPSPLDNALGYLPADAPAAIAVSTNLDSGSFHDLDIALQRFGVQGGVEGSLEDAIGGAGGVSFSNDIKPLLGNDLVIGLLPGTTESGPRVVAVLEVTDGSKVEDLLNGVGFPKQDDIDGTHVYGPDSTDSGDEDLGAVPEIAVDGDTVVVAESMPALKAALDQRHGDGRLTEATFDDRLEGLPKDGLIRATGDLPSAVDALGAEQTSGVPWMASLRSFGLSVDIDGRTLTADGQVKTDHVDEADLPIAAGSTSPDLAPHLKSAATLDQGQSMRFALDLVRASVPTATFNQIQARLERAAHGSLGALEDEFGAGLITELPNGETVTRSEVKNPAAVARTLGTLSTQEPAAARAAVEGGAVGDALNAARILIPALPVPQDGYFPSGSKVTAVPGRPGLYELAAPPVRLPIKLGVPGPLTSAASDTFYFGVIGSAFVTAPSLNGAEQAAGLRPADLGPPPGSFAFSVPLTTGDVGFGGSTAKPIKLTTLIGAVEASSDGLQLRAHAGL
jgi:hypothetical protein